ncbi:MAG: M55 family metallopeptidase [Armatimonadota bacterium]|nr:M55 family metallopeptidase [Armatimonadota bacterium]
MKIYILCDLEGTAGVVDFQKQTYPDGKYHEEAKRLATLEVNAVVEGALEGGATEIVVLDGHGPGGLSIEEMHPGARWLLGRPIPSPWRFGSEYDALFLYGHHSMAGTECGVLSHSWSSRAIANCWLNGELIGEIGANCALAGHFGRPTVFISGDRAAVEEARRYVPGIEGVVVKEGVSRTAALSLAPARAREELRAGARRAMGRIGEIAPYRIAPPYVFRTQYLSWELAENAARRPGAKRVDLFTVEIESDDLVDLLARR